MKKIAFLLVLLIGCIQTDLEDPFPPTLQIDNSIRSIEFRVNGSYPLSAIYTDHTGEPASITINWESSDETILSFEENVAMVHSEGLVIIRASANGLEAALAIETFSTRGSLLITGFTPKIQSGSSTPFKFNFIDLQGATNNTIIPQWSSSDESVATIDQNGVVAALSPGSTDIIITFDGITNTTKLEVSNDPVMLDPVVRIVQFGQFLNVGDSFSFLSDYYGEDGSIDETANINWSSSNASILSIDTNGLASAHATGMVMVVASFQGQSTSVSVEVEGGGQADVRTGTLMGTGYSIEGQFTLGRNEEGDLILTVIGYKPDGPGPYFYLTNQETNVNNGINLGEAKDPGDITINISDIDNTVELSTFNFLMVWCEPFRVRLGIGEFEN